MNVLSDESVDNLAIIKSQLLLVKLSKDLHNKLNEFDLRYIKNFKVQFLNKYFLSALVFCFIKCSFKTLEHLIVDRDYFDTKNNVVNEEFLRDYFKDEINEEVFNSDKFINAILNLLAHKNNTIDMV